MGQRRLPRLTLLAGVSVAAFLTTGCGGLRVTLSANPSSAQVNQPITYTVEFENMLTCNVTDPTVVLIPLAEQDEDFEFLCELIANPILDTVCNSVETPEEALLAADLCCSRAEFAVRWPDACGGGATAPLRERAQQLSLEDMLNKRSIRTHAKVMAAAAASAAPNSSLNCTPLGPVVSCTGTLAPGDKATVSITVTPTATGAFRTLVYVAGTATCSVLGGADGGLCLSTTVRAPAPAVSNSGLLALALLLGAAGIWRTAVRVRRGRAT